jgi:PleD family two-component response regulator
MSHCVIDYHPKPLILLASAEAWQRRELESALTTAGFRVVTAQDERETLEHAHQHQAHGIVLDVGVAPPGFGLCRTLRTIALATPIVMLHPGQPTRGESLEAVRAGAWDVYGAPVDTETFLLRLAAYVEPKVELDRVSDECLVDRVSGLYNHSGLARRAHELAALATRYGLALACVVFRPAQKLLTRAAGDRLAKTFKSVGRSSDAVGRTGPSEFAIFAPTRPNGATARMVRRLTETAEREVGYIPERRTRIGVRSGYSTTGETHKITPHTLLARARKALESTPSE